MNELRRRAPRIALESALAVVGFAMVLAPLNQWLIAGILAAIYGGRLFLFADRATRVYYLGFGLGWVVFDVAFVRTGVFIYSESSALGPPVYMPLVFGQLAVLVGESVGWLPVKQLRLPLLADLALVGACAGAVLLWHRKHPNPMAIAFTLLFFVRAWLSRKDRASMLVALAFGFGEPVIEAILINRGLFVFSRPAFLGVPTWYWSFFALASYPVTRAFGTATARLRGR